MVAEIELPDPSLVVLIGAAGAGKSTFAARHFAADEVLSSDRYRALVSGDEANQAATRAAFLRLHRDLEARLADGLLTVVDATSVQAHARGEGSWRGLRRPGCPRPRSCSTWPPKRSSPGTPHARPGPSTTTVVRRQLADVRKALDGPAPPLDGEGFAQVVVLRDPAEVDAVRIRRRSA